jgi:ABC-type Mn2+/Zn2+ transport system permease subunit
LIAEFIDSWALFGDAYMVGLLIAALLPLLGVFVVARDQIFVGAAVSQAAALGIAVGMVLASTVSDQPIDPLHAHDRLSVAASLAAIAAAWLTTRTPASGSYEAITGWVFLFSSSVSILLLAHSPYGLEEIHHLVSSSIIGATRADVWWFALLTVGAITIAAANRDRLALFMMDPPMAAAVGIPVKRWSGLYAAALGIAIGLAMRSSGLLFSFGSLVLPPLIAAQLCRESRSLFALAPAIGVFSALIGFIIANGSDFPPAQMAVAGQALLLAAAWGVGALTRRSK